MTDWFDAFRAAKDTGDFLKARAIATAATQAHEGEPRAWAALANIAARLGEFALAQEAGQTALCLDPGNMRIAYALSLEYLRVGRFDLGWPLYGARLASLPTVPGVTRAECRRVWLDQGVGDQIMFASVIPDLEPGWHTYLCDPRLVPVFQRSFPTEKFEGTVGTPAAWDCTLAFLAQQVRPTFETFPGRKQYVYAKMNGLRPVYDYGVSHWSYGTKDENYKGVPMIDFVHNRPEGMGRDLQYHPRTGYLWDSLDELAQEITLCKCVVTTSNVTAHMAGALGVPTLVMIPLGFGQMWHWFLDRKDSPWYPAVEITRQVTRGDWGPCLERAKAFVAEHA